MRATRDGSNHTDLRPMGQEAGLGVGINLGAPSDFGRSPGILEQSEDKGVGNEHLYGEGRVRDRRNSDDSFFYARSPDMFPSAGLSLPPTPKQSSQFYQSTYQQQQQQHQQQYREDRQQGAQQADYENERRERSRSCSTTGSLSTGGKTSVEQLENNKERDTAEDRFQINSDQISGNNDQHNRTQQNYVYSAKEGQYILR